MEISLDEISNLIQQNIPKQNFILTAEVSGSSKRNQHLYLTLKDKQNQLATRIWNYPKILKDKIIEDGDKIKVEGKLNYYAPYGSLNFIIEKLIKKEGEGDLYLEFIKNKNEFEKKGYFNSDRKKIINNLITEITILTSKDGDALQDFKKNLERENSKISINLVPIAVQGKNCPLEICEYLKMENDLYKEKNKKIIVITRGGGSFEDLNGFNQPELINAVFENKHYILSAIGHQKDVTLLDMVADISKPTPSLISTFLINFNQEIISNYQNKIDEIEDFIKDRINYESILLERMERNLEKKENEFEDFIKENQNKIIEKIREELYQLELLESSLGSITELEIKINQEKINSLEKVKLLFENDKFIIKVNHHQFEISNYQIKEI